MSNPKSVLTKNHNIKNAESAYVETGQASKNYLNLDHWLLLIWTIPSFIDATYNAIRFPENYRFRGDTLGVDVSLAWVGPLFFGGLAALSVVWVIRDLRQRQARETPAWNRANTILFAIAIALLPVQFALLRFGEPHGTTDQIGVLLTIAQWVILNMAFAPRERKATASVRTA